VQQLTNLPSQRWWLERCSVGRRDERSEWWQETWDRRDKWHTPHPSQSWAPAESSRSAACGNPLY